MFPSSGNIRGISCLRNVHTTLRQISDESNRHRRRRETLKLITTAECSAGGKRCKRILRNGRIARILAPCATGHR